MAGTIRDVMTPDPITLGHEASMREAARVMRDWDIGDVLVKCEDGRLGIVTDRDLVIRGTAEGLDPDETPLQQVCSNAVVTLSPDDPIDRAVQLVGDRAIRRLPVVTDGAVVGIVSLGDLAVAVDPVSALAEISAAKPNH